MLIYVFDKGMFMYFLVKVMGGKYFIVVVDDDKLVFCFL